MQLNHRLRDNKAQHGLLLPPGDMGFVRRFLWFQLFRLPCHPYPYIPLYSTDYLMKN